MYVLFYINLHIIITTALVPTKFCTMTQTAKYSWWTVQTCMQQL